MATASHKTFWRFARRVAATAFAVVSLTSPARADVAPKPSSEPSPDAEPPPAQRGRPLAWDKSFNRMDAPEMIVTGVAATTALVTYIIHPFNTGWNGPILFDEDVRKLRLGTLDAQYEARSASDLGLALIATYPILVDSVLVAYWQRGSSDVALQMALIDLEALSIVGAIEGTTNILSGRARPYHSACGTGVPSNTSDCSTDTLNRSFFSGHTAISFTSAALICAHHEALHLFDNPAADHIACIAAFAAASTVGALRIAGDAHYFSDVFIGALVGTTVGLTIPLLHHYRRSGDSAPPPVRVSLMAGPGGAQIVGTF